MAREHRSEALNDWFVRNGEVDATPDEWADLAAPIYGEYAEIIAEVTREACAPSIGRRAYNAPNYTDECVRERFPNARPASATLGWWWYTNELRFAYDASIVYEIDEAELTHERLAHVSVALTQSSVLCWTANAQVHDEARTCILVPGNNVESFARELRDSYEGREDFVRDDEALPGTLDDVRLIGEEELCMLLSSRANDPAFAMRMSEEVRFTYAPRHRSAVQACREMQRLLDLFGGVARGGTLTLGDDQLNGFVACDGTLSKARKVFTSDSANGYKLPLASDGAASSWVSRLRFDYYWNEQSTLLYMDITARD